MTRFDPDNWNHVIALAYDRLSEARSNVYEAVKEETEVKRALEVDRTALIVHGITGKNAEEREANLRDALSERYAALETAAGATALERLEYDLAGLEVDRIRLTLRALALESSRPGGDAK